MRGSTIRSQTPFLDITEYLLKEHSPYFRPKIPEHHQIPSPRNLTPELSPVIDCLASFAKTPLGKTGKQIGSSVLDYSDFNDFDQFSLQGESSLKNEPKSKKIRKTNSRPRLHSTWHHADFELDKIIEQNCANGELIQNSFDQDDDSSEEEEDQMMDMQDSEDDEGKQIEMEKQSTTNFDLLLAQEPIYLEWHNTNPKKELLTKLKTVCSSEQLKTEEQKLTNIKSTISTYIFDHEKFYFEESMNQLNGSISAILATLIKGIDQTFKKTIGGLSFEKRRIKLVKYMEKKRRRVWRKKVNYDCRKKVADGRLRIKGKFVTYEQARQQLGMSSLEGYNADEIRNMLEKRAES